MAIFEEKWLYIKNYKQKKSNYRMSTHKRMAIQLTIQEWVDNSQKCYLNVSLARGKRIIILHTGSVNDQGALFTKFYLFTRNTYVNKVRNEIIYKSRQLLDVKITESNLLVL